jgi:hypothetical protein
MIEPDFSSPSPQKPIIRSYSEPHGAKGSVEFRSFDANLFKK